MAFGNPPIGKLRWLVVIARRIQAPAGTATISETLDMILPVHADIQPIAPMTFVQGQQTDRPITHRMFIRWLDWVDQQHVIVRNTTRADNTVRQEVFRIRKIGEVEGRKRFLELLVEQESRA